MKKEHISDALNMLNDDIIEETNNVRTNAKPKRRWERQIAAVACICLIVVGVFAWRNFSNHSDSSTEITMSDKGVTIPKLEVSLSAESSADMLGFSFIKGIAMFTMTGYMMMLTSLENISALRQG